MATAPRRWLTPNPPTPPVMGGGGGLKFPKDLDAGGRNYHTNIFFQDYSISTGGGLPTGEVITLPIPRKINDVQTVIWEQTSVVAAGLGLAASMPGLVGAAGNLVQGNQNIIDIGGAMVDSGYRLNPFLLMLFKQPDFKSWNLQWTLAPNSQDETETITKIITALKRNMSPGTTAGKGFYTYPALAQVVFSPSQHLTRLKPAAIMAVQVDYMASGTPSFIASRNGSTPGPTVVNLTLSLKETELWTKNDF